MTRISEDGKKRIEALNFVQTIPQLLTQHLDKRPDAIAYKHFNNSTREWMDLTFRQTYDQVMIWRYAFAAQNLSRGDRVAMLLPNCIDAVFFDQAALANALVPVPLHAIDTPQNSAFIINNAGVKVLFTNKLLKWKALMQQKSTPTLELVVITDDTVPENFASDVPVMMLKDWLATGEGSTLPEGPEKTDLAAIVYTSGTTGNPKGVMLTHDNVVQNVRGVLSNLQPQGQETFLSFLPLSHTFERTTSYYLSLGLGCTTAFNRSIATLQEDFKTIRPTILMSVPRVYEMIYGKLKDGLAKKSAVVNFLFNWAVEVGWRRFCRREGLPVESSGRAFLDPLVANFLDQKVGKNLRAVFGDRIHLFISGGAALNPTMAKTFLALGVDIYQGYGLTETSPIISVNKEGANFPHTVGHPLKNLQVRLGEMNELQINGPSVMQGYWKRDDANKEIFTEDGWFRTGDIADILPTGHIQIKGRIKEIIVTSSGEKVPPSDIQAAIENDQLFDQSMVLGDDRPFISAIAVLNPMEWDKLAKSLNLDPANPESLKNKEVLQNALRRIKAAAAGFPNYGIPRQVTLTLEPWTIDNNMLTPTLKLKRRMVLAKFTHEINAMYDALAPKKH